MKKLCFICCLLYFGFYANTSFSQPKKQNKKSIFIGFNFLANNLSLKYNKLILLNKTSAISYSIGLSNMYMKTGFIVPPNLGTPIEINYLIGKRWNYIEAGISIIPHFIFSKGYTHFNQEDLEVNIVENTNLIYITPHKGIRKNIKNTVDFKISVGPKIKLVESNNEYIGRIFENKKYLEIFFFQLAVGFPI
jgi:hypothetical protein